MHKIETKSKSVLQKEMQEKFNELPTPEEWSQFVTWPALEDALKGIRDALTPPERVVIEMSSQTEPVSACCILTSMRKLFYW